MRNIDDFTLMIRFLLIASFLTSFSVRADELDKQKIYVCTLHPQSKPGAPTGLKFRLDMRRNSLTAYSPEIATCVGYGNVVSSQNQVLTIRASIGGGLCKAQGFGLEWSSVGGFVPASPLILFVNYNTYSQSFYACQRIK